MDPPEPQAPGEAHDVIEVGGPVAPEERLAPFEGQGPDPEAPLSSECGLHLGQGQVAPRDVRDPAVPAGELAAVGEHERGCERNLLAQHHEPEEAGDVGGARKDDAHRRGTASGHGSPRALPQSWSMYANEKSAWSRWTQMEPRSVR